MRTLVLGGARSGKSSHAESLLLPDQPVRYVATARVDPADAELAGRIRAHSARRPPGWTTVTTADLPALLRSEPAPTLVDDLGTWLTAELDDAAAWTRPEGTITPRVAALVAAVRDHPEQLVLVSPEVGLSVVPVSAAGRLFRDALGTLNQQLAAVCDRVLLVVAGLPQLLKGPPSEPPKGPS